MSWIDRLERRAPLVIGLACAFYATVETAYVLRLPLVMDEFQGAADVYRLLGALPYRDFEPYKTLLGYYLQLPLLAWAPSPWVGLMSVKLGLAALNTGVIAFAALRLCRVHRPAAVCLGTFLLVTMSTFLERSAALRVDMLTSALGLISLLLLLERRKAWAGLIAGLSFLVSQKGLFFLAAGAGASLAPWLFARPTRAGMRPALAFGLAALAPVGVYVVLWSALTSFDAVWEATFVASRRVALGDFYDIRHFWFQTFFRNPFFYGAAALALGRLFAERRRPGFPERDALLLSYACVLLLLCLWWKQPWPYSFVLLIPTLYVLVVRFFDGELEPGAGSTHRLTAPLLATTLIAGILWPASRIPQVLGRSSEFQRRTVAISNALLDDGDSYLAGLELLYDRPQSVTTLRWLDAPHLREIQALDAPQRAELVAALRRAPIKLVVWNYRLAQLPDPIRRHLFDQYAPFATNVLLYAPAVPPGASDLALRFDGTYRVRTPRGDATVAIDGRDGRHGETFELAAGPHRVTSETGFRLEYVPTSMPRPTAVPGPRPLFENVYTY